MLLKRCTPLFQFLIWIIAGMLLLTACELHARTTRICEWGEVPRIQMVSPADFSIITDLTPTISWTYGESSCVPAQYKVNVWSAMTYPVGASAGYFLFSDTSTDENLEWPAGTAPLQPGKSYYIYVTALTFRDGELTESTGTFSYFSTGPLCSASDSLGAPNLRWPPDGWKLDPTTGMNFEWGSSMTCWPENDYFIEISKYADFHDPVLLDTNLPLEHLWLYPFMGLPWENCTPYFWHVRPNILGTEDEPFSETRSFLIQPGDTICPLDLSGQLTLSEATAAPRVHLNVDANCLSSPTNEYRILDTLMTGTELPIQGRNRAGDSWLVEDANISKSCWVYGDWVEVVGDTSLIGIVDPQPPGITLPTRVHLNVDAYCRSGPTSEYLILDTLMTGTELPIRGRNRAGDSWLVEDANISKSCWVYGDWVEVVGDTSLIGIIDPQPPGITLPTATAEIPQVNCAQYNSNLCGSQPACKWEAGVCKNK